MAQEWVLEGLKEMNKDDNIGLEEETIMMDDNVSMTCVKDVNISEREWDGDDINGVYLLDGNNRENEIMQSIELVEHNDGLDEIIALETVNDDQENQMEKEVVRIEEEEVMDVDGVDNQNYEEEVAVVQNQDQEELHIHQIV
jgi:hypothetical protein